MIAVRRLTAVAAASLVSVVSLAPLAHAEDSYRYWSYWQSSGQWEMAQKGPDEIVPADGTVEGWRYATAGMNEKRTPRTAGDFGAICAQAPAEEGRKRVAVVVDQGTAADAPSPGDKPNGQVQGVCVVAAPEATAAQVLAMVGEVRKDKGVTCAINGYPASTCMETVKNAAPAAPDEKLALTVLPPKGSTKASAAPAQPAQPADGTSGLTGVVPWAIGGALVVALGAGAYAMNRRRSRDDDASA